MGQAPDVVLGAGFTHQLETILGTGPVSFALSDGTLPPGLAMSANGLVSGAPSGRDFRLTVRATDSAGAFVEQWCVMQVLPPVAPPAGLVAWSHGEPAVGGVVSDPIGGYNGGFFSGAVAHTGAYGGRESGKRVCLERDTIRPVPGRAGTPPARHDGGGMDFPHVAGT